jgi:predicted porin
MIRNKTLPVACAAALIALSPSVFADVTLKGQVNRAVMYADDGVDSDTFFVDNDNSSTRIIIDAKHPLNADVTVGAQFEVEQQSKASNEVSIVPDPGYNPDDNAFKERKLELYFASKTLGTLWLGQGDTASNGTSEVDLSGTTVASYSDTGGTGGALHFRLADGTKLGTVYNYTNNFDGLSRQDRIRYDTPSLAGFMLSASAVSEEQFDVALRYNNDFGFMKLAGAIAYADFGDSGRSIGDSLADNQFNGSISALFDFGLSLTLAGGTTEFDSFSDLTDIVDDSINLDDDERNRDEPINYWGKLGYQFNALPMGKTAVSIEYGVTEDYRIGVDEYSTYGASLVQNIDKASTELFLHYQGFELDMDVVDPEDIFVVMGGARVKF